MRGFVAVCCVLAGGCFSPSPQAGAPCGSNGECPDGLACNAENKCEKPGDDRDAGLDDDALTDACPGATCDGDTLLGCGAPIACASGCASTPEAHCKQLVPSNGVTVAMLPGATADVTYDKLTFDTDDGSIRMMGVVIRTAGTGVIAGIRYQLVDNASVWTANSWQLPVGGDWSFSTEHPAVLFANTFITIAEDIDVGGVGTQGGPGGFDGNGSTTVGTCRGRAGRLLAASFGEGGGGAGGRSAGGAGAPSNQAGQTGIAGQSCGTGPTTIPLRGGNSGGHGGESAANGGGGGGGAIALVAMGQVTISADVGAPGAGGLSGATTFGGGGGGGGGAIFVESPLVTITGRLTANGGGGGAPAGGADGVRGSMSSSTMALGGAFACVTTPGAAPVTRRGGSGGVSTGNPPTDGANCTSDDGLGVIVSSNGGGGGGAGGRIEIRRVSGSVTGLTSPPASLTTALVE